MSQTIFSTINPGTTSGNQLATILNDFKDAIVSGLSGTARPANLQAGGYWIDTTLGDTPTFLWTYKMYTGTADVVVFTLNLATNTISVAGGGETFQLTKISADAVGPILKLIKKRVANNGQLLTDDSVGEIQFVGQTSTNASPIVARIKSFAAEAMTDIAQGASIIFETIGAGQTNLAEVMRIISAKVGIGTNAPDDTLHVVGTAIRSEFRADSTAAAKFILKKKRLTGTGGSTAVDSLGILESRSTDSAGTDFSASRITTIAQEDHTSTNRGSKMEFNIIKTGATVQTIAMAIGDQISLNLGTTIEGYTLNQQSVATAATFIAASATKSVINFTGSTTTDIQGIDATSVTKTLLIHNGGTAVITLRHENAGATAANRLKLPLGRDIVIPADSSIELFYSVASSRWKLKSGSGSGSGGGFAVIGTAALPTYLDGTAQMSVSQNDPRQMIFISAPVSNGPTTFSNALASPLQGSPTGTELVLIGTSDDDSIEFRDSKDIYGMNGNWTASLNSSLHLLSLGVSAGYLVIGRN